jgi:hypothetical protein
MSAHFAHATGHFATPRQGPARTNMAPVFWLLVLAGIGAVLMGLAGGMVMAHIEQIGTATVQGMSDTVFRDLVIGGLGLAALGVGGLWTRNRDVASR